MIMNREVITLTAKDAQIEDNGAVPIEAHFYLSIYRPDKQKIGK